MAPGERVYSGTRLQKLGIRAGARVLLAAIDDPGIEAELTLGGAEIVNGPAAEPDVVLLGVHSLADLRKIATYRQRIGPQGALWVVRPKGPATPVPERETMAAGLEAGLVDVKVVSFSPTHSALKYVYRLRDR